MTDDRLVELQERRAANAELTKIDNSTLYAGSPMYYYCHGCNALQVLSECHPASAIQQFCDDCQSLIDEGEVTAEELRAGNT